MQPIEQRKISARPAAFGPHNTCGDDVEARVRKATLMTIFLAFAGNSAAAEWVWVSDNEISTSYFDAASIRGSGNSVKLWTLLDFKAAQPDPVDKGLSYLSTTAHIEFDCRRERGRLLAYALHTENMGRGRTGDSGTSPTSWEAVAPDSARGKVRKIACGKP